MKQQFITFNVDHQIIKRTDNFEVVGGSRNYLYAQFTCCDDWTGEQITAVFTPGGRVAGKPYTQPVVDGQCLVPWEVLTCKKFYVGLMAGARITSNAAVVDVTPCGVGDGDPAQPPTPTAYERLLDKTAELDDRVEKLEQGGTGGGGSGGGGVEFTTDETLSLVDGILSVNTADDAEKDNTLPITSAAVQRVVGNIEVILGTI